mgnify:CR=1 FL=1
MGIEDKIGHLPFYERIKGESLRVVEAAEVTLADGSRALIYVVGRTQGSVLFIGANYSAELQESGVISTQKRTIDISEIRGYKPLKECKF